MISEGERIDMEKARDKSVVTRCIRVYGIVQGVGFRPTASRLAKECGITGSVSNKGSYVEIIAQGTEEETSAFFEALIKRPPRRAVILKSSVKAWETDTRFASFEIVESVKKRGEIFISPDIAICEECREELYNPANRRYLHPFINCTSCGPRLTILDALPYDRSRTSMKDFPMCPDCEREYYDPKSRRYDAQPVCCNDCGPRVYLLGRHETGPEAIRYTRELLARGGIAAVKGIGGFHLCCDASNPDAVALLRKRKSRPTKPFAVMMKDMETVERECVVPDAAREILTGHQKPILLLERKKDGGAKLCEGIAPGNPKVGVMLPYAPIQMLLFDYQDETELSDILVMTSGNVSGAPICRSDEDVLSEIADFCDCILSHDRKIRIRCDDSVMDLFEEQPYMIRRSRGFAPLPYLLSEELQGRVLAVGGELKNSFCIGIDSLFYPSSYIGDLADVRSTAALRETIGRMETLLETKPELVACDLHPGYASTELAESLGLPLLRIQHHYAHIVSCMAENDYSGEVLGASFDGTGYGTDGTIWGGEILRASFRDFQRLGSIRPFWQSGGDAASREGFRVAFSMIYGLCRRGETFGIEEETMEGNFQDLAFQLAGRLGLTERSNMKIFAAMYEQKLNTIRSSSAGRLFDAVSAVLGICRESTFEGEASSMLEFCAEAYEKRAGFEKARKEAVISAGKTVGRADGIAPDNAGMRAAWEAAWEEEKRAQGKDFFYLPTDSLFSEIVQRRLSGEDPAALAFLFHERLALQIVEALLRARDLTGIGTAALSGGVFQNRLLLRLVKEGLERERFRVLIHHYLPPNDGGICLGQAVAAAAFLTEEKKPAIVSDPGL